MQLWRDRFLISVLIITATVILGMFIFQIQWNKKMLSEITSRRTLNVLAQTEVKSSSTIQSLSSPGPFRVIRVLDGDTLVLDNG